MKKTLICSALAFLGIGNQVAQAQVDDISLTLSPTINYTWFDNNTSIKDGFMYGARVGFGFGENFELRATYEKSLDLKNTIDDIDALSKEYKNKFEARKVNVQRWGGEMKANIPTGGGFAPYLTLGTGVQTLEIENSKDQKQIYVSAGLGTKINLSDRVLLNLEAKNTAFNLDRSSVVFQETPKDQDDKKFFDDSDDERMYNWSVMAGLQFYLGGKNYNEMNQLDREYLQKFSGGLKGFKFIIEPGGAYIDFNKNLELKDTYLVGGSAGFDLNQYIGFRGFYYQATKDEKFKQFDNLAMYGGELNAKLNIARGVVPYVTFGGGYINAYGKSYEGESGVTGDYSTYFVKGGAGAVVPLAKYFDIFGAANLLYTTEKKAENLDKLQNPDELRQSVMYNVGIRFKIGEPAKPTQLLDKRLNSNNSAYQERINELEAKLRDAYNNNDSERAVEVIKEKQRLENNGSYRIRMTPAELEKLIEKTIDEVDSKYYQKATQASNQERINRLEEILVQINSNGNAVPQNSNVQDVNSKILAELKALNTKVDSNSQKINMLASSSDKTVVVNPTQPSTDANKTQPVATTPAVTTTDEGNPAVAKSLLLYEGISLEGGAAFTEGNTSGTFGVRAHYGFSNSNFELQPGVYVGFAGENAFGVNANAIYKFKYENNVLVQPYLGAGVGFNKVGGESKFGANLVVGTSFNVLDGKLYVDYSALNLFDINKVSVGYKLGF